MAPPSKLSSSTSPSTTAEGAPAGYGRSCTNCSRAKCKCILRVGGSGECERCHRLGKPCQPIAATRKRVQKRTMPSRTAQLEEKLDDLVSILRSSQGAAAQSQQRQPDFGLAQTTPPSNAGSHAQPSPISRLESLATAASASNPHPVTPPSFSNINANYNESDENSEPTPAEAELYLQKFRHWLTNFPFMVIPPETTAASLKQERPFLWLCLMNITSMSVPQMDNMKAKVRREVAERLVVNHEPSMDLLLGLIAYMAWATLNAGPNWKPFLVLFSQMALCVSFELGLARSFAEEQYFATCFKAWGPRVLQPRKRTIEERRALLSLWFLTSTVSSFFGKMDAMRWSTHLEECLESLEAEKDDIQDGTLTALVRTQLVAHEVLQHIVQDSTRGDTAGTPSYVYRKSLLGQLQSVRDDMSEVARSNPVVLAHGYATEMHIHSMGLFKATMPQSQRVDALYSCLKVTRSWYDIWFSIPLPAVPGLPFSFFIQLNHTQVALYRLSTMEDPNWDKELLRSSTDLLNILDRTIERFEQMEHAYPLKSPRSDWTLFGKAARIIRNVKANWEPTLTTTGRPPTPNSQSVYSSAIPSTSGGMAPESATPDGNRFVPMDRTDFPTVSGSAEPGSLIDPLQSAPPLADTGDLDFTDLPWLMDVFVPWEL